MSKISRNTFSSYETLDEKDLVLKAQSGDDTAFGILYTRYIELLTPYLTYKTGDNEVGKYLAHETLVKAWRSLESLRGPFRPWLYSIAKHMAIDYFRQRKKKRVGELDEEAMEIEDVGLRPEEQTEIKERLVNALADISPVPRACFILYRIQGLSIAEIAERLSLRKSSVKTYISSAARELREIYTHP